MDVSNQYVEMCDKACEVQDCRTKLQTGDFYCIPPDSNCKDNRIFIQSEGEDQPYSIFIWLPRQSQLQEMVFEKTAVSLACRFKDFIVRPLFDKTAAYKFTPEYSMKQLWLAFVMYTLYKKCWDSDKKEWEKR